MRKQLFYLLDYAQVTINFHVDYYLFVNEDK